MQALISTHTLYLNDMAASQNVVYYTGLPMKVHVKLSLCANGKLPMYGNTCYELKAGAFGGTKKPGLAVGQQQVIWEDNSAQQTIWGTVCCKKCWSLLSTRSFLDTCQALLAHWGYTQLDWLDRQIWQTSCQQNLPVHLRYFGELQQVGLTMQQNA